MFHSRLFGAALLLALASTANATSFVVTTDTVVRGVAASTDATSDVSSSFRDDKIVQAARDDAPASLPATVTSAARNWRALSPTFASRPQACRPATRNWHRPSWRSEAARSRPCM